MNSNNWSPWGQLKAFSLVLLRKFLILGASWVVVYFISQPFRNESQGLNILALFAPVLGGLAGIVVGWYFAQDAAEDAGFTGMLLWALLVGASWAAMWVPEGILYFLRGRSLNFGGWMLMSAAMLMSLAAAIWRSSADE